MFKSILLIAGVVIGMLAGPVSASTSTPHPIEMQSFNKLKPFIFEAERRTGISAELLTALLSTESTMGTDTRNCCSSATGVMQYTARTWRNDIKKYHKQLGLSANASARNPRAAILVTAAALADNKVYLEQRTGRTVSKGDLYMSHFVGLYGAEKVLKGKSSVKLNKVIALHKGNGNRYHVKGKVATVAQFRAKMENVVNSHKKKYVTALNNSRMDNLIDSLNHPQYDVARL